MKTKVILVSLIVTLTFVVAPVVSGQNPRFTPAPGVSVPGDDMRFVIDHAGGNVVVGRLMVRVGDQWYEATLRPVFMPELLGEE